MRYIGIAIFFFCGVTACNPPSIDFPDGFWEQRDGGTCSRTPDMTSPMTKCAAAKGLPGDNLICTDFPSQQSILDLMGAGWSFSAGMSGTCTGWSVMNSKLQVTNFSALMGSCGFTMRSLTSAEYNKYNSFTLSVVHTVEINKQRQSAAAYLGLDVDTQQIWSSTSTNSHQVTMIKIDRTALPNGGSNTYQPFFKITSTAPSGGYQGWLIESLAVNGNP